jgi:peptidoglycan hydrolase-like protein with peptidoglycan-binding domain
MSKRAVSLFFVVIMGIFVSTLPLHKASANLSTGLVGYWKFDEKKGHAVSDSSSSHNDGSIVGVGSWGSGKINNAVTLDGASYISVVGNNLPIGNSSYTISAWFKTDGYHGAQGIIGWGGWGDERRTNALRLSFEGECPNSYGFRNYWWSADLDACVDTNIFDNEWHLIVAEYDGATRRIFLDGNMVAQDIPGANDVPYSNNAQIGITNGVEPFEGSLDDIRVYNRALSDSEIQAVYKNRADDNSSVGGFATADTLAKAGIRLVSTGTIPEIKQNTVYHFPRTLKFGTSGDDVVVLQKFLGITPPPSKYFGYLTQAALIKYQKDHGLDADGVAGPKTFVSIENSMLQ